MPAPFESAQLNLHLFDLRREPVLREARSWFLLDFNPQSVDDVFTTLGGDRNASFRMVLGYWDMAASLVTTGAINLDSFIAAHGEIVGTFSKVYFFLAEIRSKAGEPDFCKHIEEVVLSFPEAVDTLKRRRDAIYAAAKAQ